MIGRLKRFFGFLGKRESFLVVEISKDFLRVSFFSVDFEGRHIGLRRSLTLLRSVEESGDAASRLRKLMKPFGKLSQYRIVLVVDSRFATTVYAPANLLRDKPKEPIDESDLDNRIAQGIWRIFDRERGRSARKMRVNDLDVVLTDVRVREVRLDRHRVLNPLGFTAKSVEIHLSQTFAPRPFLEALRAVVPWRQVVFLVEEGIAIASILAKPDRRREFLFVEFHASETQLFLIEGSLASYVGSIPWGGARFLEAIREEFAVSKDVAEKIFMLYLVRQASPSVVKRLEKLLLSAFAEFGDALREVVVRYGVSTLYLFSFGSMPEFVFSPAALKLDLRRRLKVFPVQDAFISEELGFDLSGVRDVSPRIFPQLAAILEFYFLPHGDKINRIARRHARWLIS